MLCTLAVTKKPKSISALHYSVCPVFCRFISSTFVVNKQYIIYVNELYWLPGS